MLLFTGVTDEQIQSYLSPWSLQFWLNLVSSWGPDDATPDLLPGIPNIAEILMDFVGGEFQDTDSCPVTCDLDNDCYSDCTDGCTESNGYQGYMSEEECQMEWCGATRDASAMIDGEPCAGPMTYPSLVLPSTCTLAGYSTNPSAGCAMNYDMTWALTGDALGVDIGINKCSHNPMSVAAVSVKCDSPDGGLCNYGRDWCSDDTACNDPFAECVRIHDYDESSCPVIGGDAQCIADGNPAQECGGWIDTDTNPSCRVEVPLELGMEDDPISQLMGEDAVPGGSWVGRCTEAECRTETGVSSGMSWTVFPNTSPNEWGWDASNNRPDIFTTDNTGSITFADWAQPELNDVVAAIVDASGVENQVLGVDGWYSHFGNPDSEGTEKRSPFSTFYTNSHHFAKTGSGPT